MQDMNNPHNPNQHAQQPEAVVSLPEYRLRKLQDALINAERSATNEMNQPAPLTVHEVPTVDPASLFVATDIERYRQNVADSLAKSSSITEQAPAIQAPNQVTPPNTFIIPSTGEVA